MLSQRRIWAGNKGRFRFDLCETIKSTVAFHFEVEPRDAALGGGWRLLLLEDDLEVGGGVVPLEENVSTEDAYTDALQAGEAWLHRS